jgi:leader peptidase (prepilin peptidase)/N-methyltransferase
MPDSPWTPLPSSFWAVGFFILGSVIGSFLNVCIHRMPRGESIISPPSHCPHCHWAIPWHLNIPLVTWLCLRGKCANCGAPISVRYFAVELLTALIFLSCWQAFGQQSAALAAIYCLFLAGLIVATFIDFEHFIIPDEITIGGIVIGFLLSFAVPALHNAAARSESLKSSGLGIIIGGGLIYGILRLGKLLFGRQNFRFPPNTKIVFSETALHLPDHEIPYEELFYRKSDVIRLHARTVELVDRCQKNVAVRLTPSLLQIGDEQFDPAQVPHMEVVSEEIVVPREAMGLGDVKFMMAIGAFLGWQAVIFSLMLSAMIGSIVGVLLILLHRREWSSRLPYGPYIALAAAIWIFGGRAFVKWWLAF